MGISFYVDIENAFFMLRHERNIPTKKLENHCLVLALLHLDFSSTTARDCIRTHSGNNSGPDFYWHDNSCLLAVLLTMMIEVKHAQVVSVRPDFSVSSTISI